MYACRTAGLWTLMVVLGASSASAQAWQVGVEGLFLQRNRPEQLDLVQDLFLPNDPIVLHLATPDFSHEGGYRITAARQLDENSALELRYTHVPNWATTAHVVSAAPGLDSLSTSPSFFVDLAPNAGALFNDFDAVTYTNTTEAYSFETNARRRLNNVATLILGLRYLRVEDFTRISASELASDDPNFNGTRNYDIASQSDLFGPQIGGELEYGLTPWLTAGVHGKTAVYAAYYDQNQANYTPTGVTRFLAVDIPPGFSFFETGGNEWGLATSVELGLFSRMYLTDSFSVKMGYELMFWNGIALAAEQYNDSLNGTEAHDDGVIVLHGLSAEATFTF